MIPLLTDDFSKEVSMIFHECPAIPFYDSYKPCNELRNFHESWDVDQMNLLKNFLPKEFQFPQYKFSQGEMYISVALKQKVFESIKISAHSIKSVDSVHHMSFA